MPIYDLQGSGKMKGKWIWINRPSENGNKDEYGEFLVSFHCEEYKKTTLKIVCDGIYSVYINGTLVAFSACADHPWYKFYDETDITEHCKKENKVKIVVWHLGIDSQTYINDKAGVIFEIISDGETVAYSNGKTLSRVINEYKNGYCKTITCQLGQSFLYDNTVGKSEYSKRSIF